jgi:hypothetical protein
MLKRFWFIFDVPQTSPIVGMGCGVTAHDVSDAEKLIREQVFPLSGAQPIERVIPDIDIQTLEEKHLRMNIGNPAVRGVWFPFMPPPTPQ